MGGSSVAMRRKDGRHSMDRRRAIRLSDKRKNEEVHDARLRDGGDNSPRQMRTRSRWIGLGSPKSASLRFSTKPHAAKVWLSRILDGGERACGMPEPTNRRLREMQQVWAGIVMPWSRGGGRRLWKLS
jgi:hypothetical protein